MSKKFVPKVLLLGTEKDLPELKIDYEIVGHLKIEIKLEDQTYTGSIFLNDEPILADELEKLPFDYILCLDFDLYFQNRGWMIRFIGLGQLATTMFFKKYVTNIGFICDRNVQQLMYKVNELVPKNQNGVLDFDSYLYRGNFFNNPTNMTYPFTEVLPLNFKLETIIEENFEPIFYNVYDRIFKNFDDVKLRSYDAIFFTADRTVDEWLDVLNWAMQSTRKVVAYVHEDSEAFEPLKNLSVDEANIEYITAVRGLWIVIESQRSKVCRVYVVYHKPYYFPALPEGYIKVHAGKKLATVDLGNDFVGDDTGDNISGLNRYLNECTVIYWAWKNTRSDYVGFCHYHRHFFIDNHVMTMNGAISQLEDCDILVLKSNVFASSYGRDRSILPSNSFGKIGFEIFCKHLSKKNPEYIPLFEKMEAGQFLIGCHMFVTRWKVFDEYCKWLFPILIPSAREFSQYHFNTMEDQRTIGFLAEEAFQVFVMHNNLRIKQIPMLLGGYESSEEDFPADEKTLFNATN